MVRNRNRSQVSAEPLRSEINVTPLVDVCLVLLILFMVVTPMLNHRAEITLPQGTRPGILPDPKNQIKLALKWPDETVWYEESWLPGPRLLAKLKELKGRTSGAQEVVLVADARLSYSAVRDVMALVRGAGFEGLSLAATREKETPSR